jgi:glutamate-1-semialdehyde aminotransferase
METLNDLLSGQGQTLYRHAKTLIPGGTQLLSKRPEQFAPDVWPAYYSKAKGTRVWDLDGREYVDMSIMAIGSAILGYADDDVDQAVIRTIQNGVASTLNCPEEVELAELLTRIHPWASMVRYARSGGEAMSVAIRIARASTRRDKVLFSGYHGWSDWYLASNLGDAGALDGQLMPGLEPNGVPRGLTGTALPFHFSDIEELRTQIKGREKEIAAIVVEPARGEEAPPEFLSQLRNLATEIGAVLIFDEITSAFRMNAGGLHLRYGISPDIAVFAKCIANGYAMAAVLGVKSVMQAAQTTFISSTNWTERVGPTAAIATIQKYIRENVAASIIEKGNLVKDIWHKTAQKHSLDIKVTGIPTLAAFGFQSDEAQKLNTVFVIEMLKRGFLGFRQFKPSFAHSDSDIKQYAEAVDDVFGRIAAKGASLLSTPVAHSGFTRLTKE